MRYCVCECECLRRMWICVVTPSDTQMLANLLHNTLCKYTSSCGNYSLRPYCSHSFCPFSLHCTFSSIALSSGSLTICRLNYSRARQLTSVTLDRFGVLTVHRVKCMHLHTQTQTHIVLFSNAYTHTRHWHLFMWRKVERMCSLPSIHPTIHLDHFVWQTNSL